MTPSTESIYTEVHPLNTKPIGDNSESLSPFNESACLYVDEIRDADNEASVLTPDDFRKHGYAIIDWIATYRETLEERPVLQATTPGTIRASLPSSPPSRQEPIEHILADFESTIVPGLLHWQHPSFFGFFPSNVELSSVLGDLLSTGLGVIGISWESGPALTELEETCMDWLRQMLGLSPAWRGVIQDSASSGTLVAIVCARERHAGRNLAAEPGQASKPAMFYTSTLAHSSVTKAAAVAGFRRDQIRIVPTRANGALDTDILRTMIEDDIASGASPAVLVATAGATATTAMDNFCELADIAEAWGMWLHVDAAMAGAAMILPECRPAWEGIERTDSIVFNPHKWLGAATDCSAMYVRDTDHLVRVMGTNPSYLRTSTDGAVTQFRDWGVPLGRRFRALKLWFLIRTQGVDGLARRLRRDIAHASRFAQIVRTTPDWRVVGDVPLQTVCVRHEPHGLQGKALDTHTRAWVAALNASGKAYLTAALVDGAWLARVSIGALVTEWPHIERLWQDMQEYAEQTSG